MTTTDLANNVRKRKSLGETPRADGGLWGSQGDEKENWNESCQRTVGQKKGTGGRVFGKQDTEGKKGTDANGVPTGLKRGEKNQGPHRPGWDWTVFGLGAGTGTFVKGADHAPPAILADWEATVGGVLLLLGVFFMA